MKEPKILIKFVRKANQWCKTTISYDAKGEKVQKQEWFSEKPQ